MKLVELKPHVVRHLFCTRGASFPGEVADIITGIILWHLLASSAEKEYDT